MSTARDTVDMPVILFGVGSAILAMGVASWTNYFYGWIFPSTASLLMLALVVPSYFVMLTLSPDWSWQSPGVDLKPQVMIASACVLLAMLILTSVAIAASTRLGQVMTIVVCAAVFLGGLLSNHFVGRFAYQNTYVAIIDAVELPPVGEDGLARGGETITLTLDQVPTDDLPVGRSFYYGPSPQGINMAVPVHEPFEGDVDEPTDLRGPDAGNALVVKDYDLENLEYTIMTVGRFTPERLPQPGDYVFNRPTTVNYAALAAWSIVPNLQSFWLIDAITQGHAIPARYVVLVVAYALVQMIGLLALAILLFQKREVG